MSTGNTEGTSKAGWDLARFQRGAVNKFDAVLEGGEDTSDFFPYWKHPPINWDNDERNQDTRALIQLKNGEPLFIGALVCEFHGFDPCTGCIKVKQFQYSNEWVVPYDLWLKLSIEPGLRRSGPRFPTIRMVHGEDEKEFEWATIGKIYPIRYDREHSAKVQNAAKCLYPPTYDDKAMITCPLCGVDVALDGIPPPFDFRTVVFREEIPERIMHGLKRHKNDCLKGPLWFLCNRLAKPAKGRAWLPVEFAQYCLQKAIYSVGAIPFPAFANTPEGRELFRLRITALFVHAIGAGTPRTTAAKESDMTEAFVASTEHILQTLYQRFMCFDVGGWVLNRVKDDCTPFECFNIVNRWFSDGGLYWLHQLPPTLCSLKLWDIVDADGKPIRALPKEKTSAGPKEAGKLIVVKAKTKRKH